jgi:hypothetical protein
MYRRTPSLIFTEVGRVAFPANLLQHLVRGGGGQGLPAAKNPDAMLLCERPSSANWAKGDFLSDLFHLQGIAWLQAQLFSQRLWNYDATSFIDGKVGTHNGIVWWVDPQIYAILLAWGSAVSQLV